MVSTHNFHRGPLQPYSLATFLFASSTKEDSLRGSGWLAIKIEFFLMVCLYLDLIFSGFCCCIVCSSLLCLFIIFFKKKKKKNLLKLLLEEPTNMDVCYSYCRGETLWFWLICSQEKKDLTVLLYALEKGMLRHSWKLK